MGEHCKRPWGNGDSFELVCVCVCICARVCVGLGWVRDNQSGGEFWRLQPTVVLQEHRCLQGYNQSIREKKLSPSSSRFGDLESKDSCNIICSWGPTGTPWHEEIICDTGTDYLWIHSGSVYPSLDLRARPGPLTFLGRLASVAGKMSS